MRQHEPLLTKFMPNKKKVINCLKLRDKIYWNAEIILSARYDYRMNFHTANTPFLYTKAGNSRGQA